MLEFKLPEIGENIKSGKVINILVNAGDTVKKDQDLIELETDKASVPIPSPCDGVIKEILIKQGQDVAIGSVIMKIEESSSAATQQPKKETPAPKSESKPAAQPISTPGVTKTAVTQSVSEPAPETHEATLNTDQHVVVIGAGPGGYPAAFHAADLGLKVTLIDEEKNPGGVCVYRGCIPSKALLHAAKVINDAKEAKDIGITFEKPNVNLDQLRAWKNKVVDQLTGGTGLLVKQRKINYIQGRATFVSSNGVNVQKSDGTKETITFDKAILATGSHPIAIPDWPKSKRMMDSTAALEIADIPKSMLLVGGGVIGLELGCVYAELGSELDVVEMLPQLLTGADQDIVAVLHKRLEKIFRSIMLETKVISMSEKTDGILVKFQDKDGKTFEKTYDKVLVAIGRRPNSKNLGLENTKVTVNDKGFVPVNAHQQTSDPSIYAIGDLVGQPMLAHKASHEGIVAAGHIAGEKVAFEPKAIPAVVYTDPEIAWCGLTETEAKAKGISHQVTKFPWAASGRAISMARTDGMTKLIFDPNTEIILGMAIVGVGAGELIGEGALAVEMAATATDIKLTIHPHPTITETVMESAESFFGHATHVYRPKRK